MDSPLVELRSAGRRLRARARVTDRLRELSPVPAWRRRTWGDLLGLNRTIALQALKIGVASAVSWLVSQWALGDSAPIYAPITAAFVGLVTLGTSIRDGTQRVVGVLVGIGVAALLAHLFGAHAWSIGLVVALGYAIGKVLHLAPGAAGQIPVTGLLLLALGAASHPVARVLETLIGAATAVVVNFVIVPPNHVGAARTAVRSLADQVVDVLSDMAAGIGEPWTQQQAGEWLQAARDRGGVSASAQAAVDDAATSLRLHPRRGEWVDVEAAVQHAARTLGVVEVQVRVIARTLRDTADSLAGGQPAGGDGDGGSGRADAPAGAATRSRGRAIPGIARAGSSRRDDEEEPTQPALPMAADMLTSTAGAIDAFVAGLLPVGGSDGAGSLAASRRAIDAARSAILSIDEDLHDLVAANLPRGIYLGTLVVETGRILDELETGLP